MDGALTFIHICVDSSQTVLEHHRSFAPFISVLIAAVNKLTNLYHNICKGSIVGNFGVGFNLAIFLETR